MEKEATLLRTE